jgi:glycosyl transferase family 25
VLPTFYINLDHDAFRRQKMVAELALCGLAGERVAGVDGRNVPADVCAYFGKNQLSDGEVGCYASHLRALKTIVDRGLDAALVLEDDASLPPDLPEILTEIVASLPAGWEFVHLETRSKVQVRAAKPLVALRAGALVRHSRLPCGAAAYLVSHRGAEKLLKPCERYWPYDVDTRRPWVWKLDAYGVVPGPIKVRGEASSILARGGRSGLRRGLSLGNPMRSFAGVAYNIEKLGFAWWLWCAAQNSVARVGRYLKFEKSPRRRRKHRQMPALSESPR